MTLLVARVIQNVSNKLYQILGCFFMSHFWEENMSYQHMPDYQPLHRCEHFSVRTELQPKIPQYICCIMLYRWEESYVANTIIVIYA